MATKASQKGSEKASAADLKAMLGKIGAGLDTTTVFGEPQVLEGRAIIPVAKISYGGGGGLGAGEGAEPEDEGSGEGMGIGFGVKAKPLGVIEVTEDDVRWIPTFDVTKVVAIAALGLLGLMMMAACAAGGGCPGAD